MKRIISLLLSIVFIFSCTYTGLAAVDINTTVKVISSSGTKDISSKLSGRYMTNNCNLMVPAESVFKEMGATYVVWNDDNTILCAYRKTDDRVIALNYDNSKVYGITTTTSPDDIKHGYVTINPVKVNNVAMVAIQDLTKPWGDSVKFDMYTATYYIVLDSDRVDKVVSSLPDAATGEKEFQAKRAIGIDPLTQNQIRENAEKLKENPSKNSVPVTANTIADKSIIKGFKDVPSSFWAHEAIMDMVERGMFSGTSTPINGIGTFSPNNTMTRAQLVVVLTRYLYPGELNAMKAAPGEPWYSNSYKVALNHGLLVAGEFDGGKLNQACTRQEMAMLLTRAAAIGTGETAQRIVPVSRIADYSSVDLYYRDYVVQAYSMGLISGTDSKGTFNPNGVLNRGQAAAVIYRLLEPATRVPVYFSEYGTFTGLNGITYEGEYENGEANGYGKMTFPKIGTYVGYFVDGKREGLGSFLWDAGDKYVGDWKDDAMSGEGTYTFPDGYALKGIWEDNQIKIRDLTMNINDFTVEVGTEKNIVALIEPFNATESIEWNSSNKSVLRVEGTDNMCKITALSPGTAKVTATASNGKKCSCIITVNEAPLVARQIELNYGDYQLDVGEKVRLNANVLPKAAKDIEVTWSSSNKSVVKVDETGVVTARSAGTAIIYASTENGLVATCYIVVEDPLGLLWDGKWTMYESDDRGNKKYSYLSYEGICEFDMDDMTVSLSQYPFKGKEFDLDEDGDYTLQAEDELSGYTYELTFTSITDEKIILEMNRIIDSSYLSDYVDTEYYVLYRY